MFPVKPVEPGAHIFEPRLLIRFVLRREVGVGSQQHAGAAALRDLGYAVNMGAAEAYVLSRTAPALRNC